MEEGILAFVESLFAEEHKNKLADDVKLDAFVGKVYEEILEGVVL